MKRYYFNIRDGLNLRDLQGEELPSIDEARRHALILAGDLLRSEQELILSDGDLVIDVVDETGTAVFKVTVSTDRQTAEP